MTTVILLAAGEGRRAWPYCGIRQKTTVPVLHVPLVRRLALDWAAVGAGEIVVVTGHRAEAVRAAVGDLPDVRCVLQKPLAGPVDAALTGLAQASGARVVLCCADIATPRANLARLLEACEESGGDPVLLTADRPEGLTSSWTTVEVDDEGLVQGVWGRGVGAHPRFGGMAAARAGDLRDYLMRNPGIMTNVGVGAMPPVEGDLAHTFELMRQAGVPVRTVHATGYFVDVDKPWHILEANAQAARHAVAQLDQTTIGPGAAIDDGAHVAPGAHLHLGPGAYIGPGCHIEGSAILGEGAHVTSGAIVGRGAVVGAHARCEKYCNVGGGAVLGPHSIVSHGAEFTGVSFERVYLYHYCSVSGLVGANVDIGAATVCGTWRFDDAVRVQDVNGRKERPECHGGATYIGDYCRTGVNAIFMPGVKIGYYACVGGGAIIYDDVPERTLILPKQELTARPWGPERLGW